MSPKRAISALPTILEDSLEVSSPLIGIVSTRRFLICKKITHSSHPAYRHALRFRFRGPSSGCRCGMDNKRQIVHQAWRWSEIHSQAQKDASSLFVDWTQYPGNSEQVWARFHPLSLLDVLFGRTPVYRNRKRAFLVCSPTVVRSDERHVGSFSWRYPHGSH